MKTRNIFGVLGLSVAAMAAAALVKGPVAKEIKAAVDDTWVIHVAFDAKEVPTWEGMDLNSFVFRCGLDGYEGWKEVSLHYSGVDSIYCANMSLAEDFSFDRMQVKFTQNGEDKWSNTPEIVGDNITHSGAYLFTYESWDSGNDFIASLEEYQTPFLQYDMQYDMWEEPVNNLLYRNNLVADSESSNRFKISYLGDSTRTADLLTTKSIETYLDVDSYNDNGYLFKQSGTFLVLLKNDNSGGGIFEIKVTDAYQTNIYYVTESASETDDWIYSWGGSQQFGEWPGTPITDLVSAGTAEEVFDYETVYFQGKSVNVYAISINVGYPESDPEGDLYFQFNSGDNTRQSADYEIVRNAAYWFTGGANLDAAAAIEFLTQFESVRGGESVCEISGGDAKNLIDTYNALSSTIREYYIDTSKLLTINHLNPSTQALYTYRQALEALSGKYSFPIIEPNYLYRNSSFSFQSTTAIIVIVTTGIITLASAVLMIEKRKKNQK